MKQAIKRVPLPLAGVMLGMAALGNLLQSYSETIRLICGAIAVVFLVLLLLKLILFPGAFKEDMGNPIMASVSGTFSMGLMLLAGYAKPFIGKGAYVIWLIAIALHIILIIYFTAKFILKLQMPKVFASYYIVYVGIAVAAVTAPAFEKEASIGTATFWFGLVTFVLLLVLVTVRYTKFKEVPKPALPLICIYAAPMSLCIAGYVQSVMPKSRTFLLVMLAVATILYIFALIKALQYLFTLPFFPSYAAFTFPFVISAIAAKQTMACCAKMEQPLPILKPVVLVETIIAVIFVVYVAIRFLMAIFSKPAEQK